MWQRHKPLASYTTFRIGGPAEWFAEPETESECVSAWTHALRTGKPIRVLGGGSNLLVDDDGLPGAVISTRRLEPRRIERRGSGLFVSAGAPLGRLVKYAAHHGWAGLEGFAGIPGLVGGATRMNAGGGGASFGDFVTVVNIVDSAGARRAVRSDEMSWRYRDCGLRDSLILSVEISLERDNPADVARRTREALDRKRATQPLSARSAGCVFRNPAAESAGRLIDEAGLKRQRVGGALVSPKHANFIVNRGAATARDVRSLIARVKRIVRTRFRAELNLEIHYWSGADSAAFGLNP